MIFRHGFSVLLMSCACGGETTQPDEDDLVKAPPDIGNPDNVALGLPVGPAEDFPLVQRPQYTLSYSARRKAANWVSWKLKAADFGPAPRNASFYGDPRPVGVGSRVRASDYRATGFDLGHICPSEERTATVVDNQATFFLANIVPQSPDANRGPWAGLERFSEHLVRFHGRDLYIVAGPVYPRACLGSNPRAAGDGCRDMGARVEIANRIAVPEAMFKIIVAVPTGTRVVDAQPSDVLSVLIPNSAQRLTTWIGPRHAPAGTPNAPTDDYIRNVAEIEALTGYRFLSALPGAGSGFKQPYFDVATTPDTSINEPVCAPVGGPCEYPYDCCAGTCAGPFGARTCR
jgi:endonuclease G, mitochondrial